MTKRVKPKLRLGSIVVKVDGSLEYITQTHCFVESLRRDNSVGNYFHSIDFIIFMLLTVLTLQSVRGSPEFCVILLLNLYHVIGTTHSLFSIQGSSEFFFFLLLLSNLQ